MLSSLTTEKGSMRTIWEATNEFFTLMMVMASDAYAYSRSAHYVITDYFKDILFSRENTRQGFWKRTPTGPPRNQVS